MKACIIYSSCLFACATLRDGRTCHSTHDANLLCENLDATNRLTHTFHTGIFFQFAAWDIYRRYNTLNFFNALPIICETYSSCSSSPATYLYPSLSPSLLCFVSRFVTATFIRRSINTSIIASFVDLFIAFDDSFWVTICFLGNKECRTIDK